ncbi:MAG TPA: SRPBCC family protein [Candidatus Acidoferrales bacterium]|nr:SRPBCC family protein [Candidatus Acidoferrales bacterium]
MANLEFVREFAVPAKEIFVFFVPQRMALWYGAEMNSCFEVQGGASDFAVGQKVRITGRLGNRDVTLTAVITAYEWERLLEWQFKDSYDVRGKQRWEFQQVGSTTRLTMRDQYEMPGRLGRIVDRLFTRYGVAARDRSWLDRLQHLAERR